MNNLHSSIKSLINDAYFNYLAIFISAGITAGLLLRDFSYWWIPAVICFLLVGRYADEKEDIKNESLYNKPYSELLEMGELNQAQIDEMTKKIINVWNTKYSDVSWQDYKEIYEEPDSPSCNTCGYHTQGCICKPVVNN